MKSLRLCFDLDGTICFTKQPHEQYADVVPIPGAVETITKLKENGCYIVIHTARNMRTHNNNIGAVIKNQAKLVVDWLEKYKIPYDELLFGKPHVDFFIDDKGIRFESWEQVEKDLERLTKTNV